MELEAFNTDGLRSLINTIDCPNMIEKTLRYPGHIEKMLVLRESGFFGEEKIVLQDGTEVRPLDVSSKLLFSMWKLEGTDDEFTVMQVRVSGEKDGKKVEHTYDLLDRRDQATGFSSMARTTGYPNVIVARALLKSEFVEHGVFPPEFLGKDEKLFSSVMKGLEERGVHFNHSTEEL